MTLAILAFLGGVLTILSPCILPVIPFVFARSERPFVRSTFPLLIGMAAAFAAVGTLAAVGGAWATNVNSYGRSIALILLALSGVALLSETVADRLTRPLAALGNRIASREGNGKSGGVFTSLLLGVATGFLWAPCAGPILGLILTGAVVNGPSSETTILLFAYAAGAIVSLGVATLLGGRVFAAMKRSLGAGEWIRRGLGVAVLVAVLAIALGWDTGVLTQLSVAGTSRVEQSLMDAIQSDTTASSANSAMTAAMTRDSAHGSSGGAMTGAMSGAMTGAMSGSMTGGAMMSGNAHGGASRVEGELPPLSGAVSWLNSSPLSTESLRGKVVMIDFWTYSCINCLRALPHVKAWYERYKDRGLVVIGVHSPEFAFEKTEANVKRAVKDLGITYPVALDNNYAIWQAFNNKYWPAHYFIDGMGRIRGHHFGEGNYEESEEIIRRLLDENGAHELPAISTDIRRDGVQAASDEKTVGSPETYLGYQRAQNFVSSGGFVKDHVQAYAAPPVLKLNEWALEGKWRVEPEMAVLTAVGGKLSYRFHARDLHLVLGPGAGGKPVRFRITIDGHQPGADHGVDIDAAGAGVAKEQRLYQLIRQATGIDDHTFTIEFLDPGVQVYSFTFG